MRICHPEVVLPQGNGAFAAGPPVRS